MTLLQPTVLIVHGACRTNNYILSALNLPLIASFCVGIIAVPNKQHAAKRHRHKRRQQQLGRAPLKEAVVVVPTQVLETVAHASKKKRQGAGASFSDGEFVTKDDRNRFS